MTTNYDESLVFDLEEDIGAYCCLHECASFIGPLAYYFDRNYDDKRQEIEMYQCRSPFDFTAERPIGGPFGTLDAARRALFMMVGGVGEPPATWCRNINNDADIHGPKPVTQFIGPVLYYAHERDGALPYAGYLPEKSREALTCVGGPFATAKEAALYGAWSYFKGEIPQYALHNLEAWQETDRARIPSPAPAAMTDADFAQLQHDLTPVWYTEFVTWRCGPQCFFERRETTMGNAGREGAAEIFTTIDDADREVARLNKAIHKHADRADEKHRKHVERCSAWNAGFRLEYERQLPKMQYGIINDWNKEHYGTIAGNPDSDGIPF